MLSVKGSDELRAAALAMRLVSRDVRSTINKATRVTLNPVWREEVTRRASTARDLQVIAKGSRIAAGNPPQAIAAASTRSLPGGLVPSTQWKGIEFGSSNREKVETYTTRSRRGRTYRVTRHTARQMPARAPRGRVAYPALAAFAPRMASLWVQTIVRAIYEASEGKRR